MRSDGAAPALNIPGPLRILVAIGSPEAQNARGELLDMEAELARILDATEDARRQGEAAVRILETGSVRAIRAALEQERWHVLYISCHARPGEVILEDEEGNEDAVSAERLWREALPAQRGVPLVVLSGCSTGRDAPDEGGDKDLPGLARELGARGVPAVLAMQGPVSDRYATDLAGQLFQALATWQNPLPLRALAGARRALETARQQPRPGGAPPPPEWPLPSLYALNHAPQSLFDPLAGFETVPPPPEPRLDRGVVVRRIGDLVGRRREQRLTLQALRAQDRAGVVLHGIGGVGKSTLAAQVMHRMAEGGALLTSLAGPVTPECVLGEIGSQLLALALEQGLDERHLLRQVALALREAKLDWEQRFDLLDEHVLGRVSLILLLDNFEDNLDPERRVIEPLGELLARWAERPEHSRLLVTSRYPFELPRGLETAFEAIHLGPLSLAETRKLVLRLPGLTALGAEEMQRAYAAVGGHPRTLEYLDALLRGGKARFSDIERRLNTAVSKCGVPDPKRWYADTQGSLDQTLAVAVTLAADDVLLDDLLTRLEAEPLARDLLLGASVYRVPIDEVGLQWQVSERMEATDCRPPPAPDGVATARGVLEDLSLLAPVQRNDEDPPRWVVHRWTAAALAQRLPAERLASAHRRAGRYWRWRVKTQPQSEQQDLLDRLEARFHHHAAGEIDAAFEVGQHACLQLETWGAWREAEQLSKEMLGWFEAGSHQAAICINQLGILAYQRGDLDQALDWYRQQLAISEQLGDRTGMARSYHQLATVVQAHGKYDQALDWYRQSLAINEQLGDRAGMANSYGQLGNVACQRGDLDQALDWHRQSRAIFEELGDRAGMAKSYGQLGIIAQGRGEFSQALDWYYQSLAISEQLGDRAGMATCYYQLGIVAFIRGEHAQALDWHRQSLAIFEELGDRAGMARNHLVLATMAKAHGERGEHEQALAIFEVIGDRAGMARSCNELGLVAQERGDLDQAVDWHRKALLIFEQLDDRASMARNYHVLGILAQARGEHDQALDWYGQALAISEQLGDRASMARSYSRLAMVAWLYGNDNEMQTYHNQALAIFEEISDRDSMAGIHYERGVAAQERGDLDQALDCYSQALAHYEKSLPPHDLKLVMARKNYTSVLNQLGRTEQASKLRTQVEEIQPPSQSAPPVPESTGAFGITGLLRRLFSAAR